MTLDRGRINPAAVERRVHPVLGPRIGYWWGANIFEKFWGWGRWF
jgi:hypothetical protein